MKWQAVFFDFDGVIVDSAPIKTEAFATMFHSFGKAIEEAVVAYHLEHQGISRFEKFRYAYEHILKIPLVENKLNQLGDEFSKIVLDAVIKVPYMPGAIEALKILKSSKIPAYVISGTPEEEVRYIIEARELTCFFQGVNGSPRSKEVILKYIQINEKYSPSKCLFIGDSLTDYIAATRTGTNFLGIVKDMKISPFPEDAVFYGAVPVEELLKNLDHYE